ncbi:hypothetical protein ACIGEP_02560 [Microbacterium sp. NPDC077663]|uniref:hypothetical protein n=1 Tax=Microbacterium sp. NPDC077663 TaxID=3364189 RepID=UPI0037C7D8B4
MLGLTWRLLVRHWPALLAWYLAGTLGRYVGLEVAGYVGGYTALGGILLIPIAILAKLLGYVGMFLVLRDGMVRLGAIAPPPTEPRARRVAFRDAMLSSILPFIAVYAALGFLVEDVATYLDTALQVKIGRDAMAAATGVDVDTSGAVDKLSWEPWTILVVVLAFAGRWAWNRWRDRLPRWSSLAATYLEGLWVFLAAYFIGDALGQVSAWVQSRRAIAWIGDLRETVGAWFAPLGWTWDAVATVIGAAAGLIGVPLAWLTVAGVIYGQAVAPQGLQWRGRLVERARQRYGTVPQRLRRRLGDIGASVGARFQPIWRALVLMWRGGPILIGGYVLAYVLLLFCQDYIDFAVTRLVGPQSPVEFWRSWGAIFLLVAPLIIEPFRTVLIASTYDATVGALIGAPVVTSGHDDESRVARQLVHDHELDAERSVDVVGHDEGDVDAERTRGE